MAIISVVGVQQFILSDYLDNHGLNLSLFNPMRSYRTYGRIAGFSRSIHYSILKKPEGYSLEKVEEITSKYESDTVDKTCLLYTSQTRCAQTVRSVTAASAKLVTKLDQGSRVRPVIDSAVFMKCFT